MTPHYPPVERENEKGQTTNKNEDSLKKVSKYLQSSGKLQYMDVFYFVHRGTGILRDECVSTEKNITYKKRKFIPKYLV